MDSNKELEALHEAEEYVVGVYTSLHSSVAIENWGYSRKELRKLECNGDGYLACGIVSSVIVTHDHEGQEDESWLIEVVPTVGIVLDAETYRVYQSSDKTHWIVESE